MSARTAPSIVLLSFMLMTPGVAAQGAQSPPDVHVIRQSRGDVLVVREAGSIDRYVAPVGGWVYRPLRPEQRLRPAFYAPRYAVSAPRGRKPARAFQRWIRYGDDLLLVNVRNGRVDQVVLAGYRLAHLR